MNILSVTIERATEKNKDFIWDSIKHMIEEQNLGYRFSQTKESFLENIFINKLANVNIAYIDDIPVGLILYSITNRNFTLFQNPGIYVHDVYVLPKYRKQNIATELFNDLKQLAKQEGYNRIDFVVLKQNNNAIEFYKNLPEAQEVGYINYMRIKV